MQQRIQSTSRLSLMGISIFSILIATFTGLAQAQPNALRYQSILDKAHRQGLPAVVALVRSPKESWRGKAGVNNPKDDEPLNIDQTFRLASISKIFTSIVVLQLADEGTIALSDNISKYLDKDTQAKIPNIESMTILHLLSHSSGIYSFTENNKFWQEAYLNDGMSRTWQPNELIEYIEKKKPVSPPLEPYSKKLYSNTNYILLGMIIENVTGNALASEYQERIFTPLKMTDTFLEGYDDQSRMPIDSYATANSAFIKSALKKKILSKTKDDSLINLSQTYKQFNSWAWAAGGISSNAKDLSVFLFALKENTLLSSDMYRVLLKLNSSEDKGISFFGSTGGSDGIQATMLHLMPGDLDIIILINSSGQKNVSLSSVFRELYDATSNANPSAQTGYHDTIETP